MTPEAQRIAIAEACGWGVEPCGTKGVHLAIMSFAPLPLPDYLNDLNAMHEAENVIIKQDLIEEYCDKLERICYINRSGITYEEYKNGVGWGHCEWFHATSAQRAEAFLRTLSLWKK